MEKIIKAVWEWQGPNVKGMYYQKITYYLNKISVPLFYLIFLPPHIFSLLFNIPVLTGSDTFCFF